MKLRSNLIRFTSLICFFALITFVSCEREDSQAGTPQEQEEASVASSESDAEAEVVFNSIFDDAMGVSDEVGLAGTGVFWGRSNSGENGDVNRTDTLSPVLRCFTVTVIRTTTNLFPVKVIIDFGTVGCPGPDGHVRRGKIIIVYTNRLIIPGAVATTEFENFYIDDTRVQGTHKITNTTSTNTGAPRQFKVEVINGKLSKPNGNYIEWNSVRTITQIGGHLTIIPRDDVFRIEGNARGRVKRGNLVVGWESSITEPLIKRFSCRWIVAGRVRTVRINLTTNSPWVAVLDFGNGVCDNQAVITINGVSRQITLP